LHDYDRTDREAWEPLMEVYRRLGDRPKLAALIAQVEGSLEDVRERARLRLERVRLRMPEGNTEEVTRELTEIVELDATQVEAALLLAEVLEKNGKNEDLANLLAGQLDLAKDRKDTASIASLARRLGTLLEAKDVNEARAVYGAGLEWAPTDRGLLRALLA